MKNVIIVVVDGLGAGHIGPYGNTWIETPHLNRLAARSMLAEFALSDSVDLPRVYRSFWQGIHAAAPERPRTTLPELVGPETAHSVLITDHEAVLHVPGAESFQNRIVVPSRELTHAATEVDQTDTARLFATAIDWLGGATEPFLLWIHARGMYGAWDAPAEYRNQFADEDDPPPPAFVEPPVRRLAPGHDPDEVLGLQQAYAGQVVLFDLCLGAFCGVLDELGANQNTMLILTSPRGYPLGEHGYVGGGESTLYGESIHVPWLLSLPNRAGAALRIGDLIQPPDLFATVLDWLGMVDRLSDRWGRSVLPLAEGRSVPPRERAYAQTDARIAFRTPAWLLYRGPEGSEELYVKPDDRLEINEISALCPEVTRAMSAAAVEFRKSIEISQSHYLAPLSDILAEGLE